VNSDRRLKNPVFHSLFRSRTTPAFSQRKQAGKMKHSKKIAFLPGAVKNDREIVFQHPVN